MKINYLGSDFGLISVLVSATQCDVSHFCEKVVIASERTRQEK